jgi:predicted dehydrogenase
MLRFGLIGAGSIAKCHAEALDSATDAALVAVADTDIATAKALGRAHSCPHYRSAKDLVDSVAIDAAIICTPPATHEFIIRRLIEHGVHVLCEKPLALSTASAVSSMRLAESHGCYLAMASKFRFVADVERARDLLLEGVIGEVHVYDNVFTSRVDKGQRWNSDPVLSGGGVLADNGPHAGDLIRFLIGPVEEVSTVEGARLQGLPVEETVQLSCRAGRGVLGRVLLSWSIHQPLGYFVRVHGSSGVLSIGWQRSEYRSYDDQTGTVFGEGYSEKAAYSALLQNFVRCVRGEEEAATAVEDALASVEFVEFSYRSLAERSWVAMPRREAARSNT